MNSLSRLAALSLVALAFGCSRSDKQADAALNSDLSLASQANTASTDSVSALERAHANSEAAKTSGTTSRTVVHHVYESSPASSGATRSAGTHVEKNTNRDAAIGAGAGAILGAVTSKNKVKGGVIGAAAGGILGAVIGNNVDKKKVPNRP